MEVKCIDHFMISITSFKLSRKKHIEIIWIKDQRCYINRLLHINSKEKEKLTYDVKHRFQIYDHSHSSRLSTYNDVNFKNTISR